MKPKINLVTIGAILTFVLSIVIMALYANANANCYGYFDLQFKSAPFINGFSVGALIFSALVIVLPMIKAEGGVKKLLAILADLSVVAVCVFLCLTVLFVAKATIYEIALTWASELHSNEPLMPSACLQVVIAMACGIVGTLVMGIFACLSKRN